MRYSTDYSIARGKPASGLYYSMISISLLLAEHRPPPPLFSSFPAPLTLNPNPSAPVCSPGATRDKPARRHYDDTSACCVLSQQLPAPASPLGPGLRDKAPRDRPLPTGAGSLPPSNSPCPPNSQNPYYCNITHDYSQVNQSSRVQTHHVHHSSPTSVVNAIAPSQYHHPVSTHYSSETPANLYSLEPQIDPNHPPSAQLSVSQPHFGVARPQANPISCTSYSNAFHAQNGVSHPLPANPHIINQLEDAVYHDRALSQPNPSFSQHQTMHASAFHSRARAPAPASPPPPLLGMDARPNNRKRKKLQPSDSSRLAPRSYEEMMKQTEAQLIMDAKKGSKKSMSDAD
ncbi:hypothetical protein PtB15_6B428 [Puccinia triticina]|nr:hypothetical protein PtB15_6B428 [Puccinia triticina]